MRRYFKQIQLGLFAAAAAAAAAGGVLILSDQKKAAPPQAEQPAQQHAAQPQAAEEPTVPAAPPLTVKPVVTQPMAPEPQPYVPPDPELESAWADKIRAAPDDQAFFTRMRSKFPSEWTQALHEASAQGGLEKSEGVDLLMSLAMRAARQNSGLLAAKAGAPALDRLFAQQLAVARQLAVVDPALCLDFLNGAPAERFTLFAATHRAVMANLALAGVEAMQDGAQVKIQREAPSQADFDQLEKALGQKGLSPAAIALLLDGKVPEPPISDDQACRNGVAYLETLASLEEPLRLRLYALAVQIMSHD